jgi:predicted aconitase with swiveling domain
VELYANTGRHTLARIEARAGSRSWRRPAILLAEPDEILVLGALVAEHLYGRTCPILVLPERAGGAIATGDQVSVSGDGTVTVA